MKLASSKKPHLISVVLSLLLVLVFSFSQFSMPMPQPLHQQAVHTLSAAPCPHCEPNSEATFLTDCCPHASGCSFCPLIVKASDPHSHSHWQSLLVERHYRLPSQNYLVPPLPPPKYS